LNNILHKTFSEVDLNDPFFQSLRDDYPGFDDWFKRKSEQDAFVQYDDNNKIIGFLYLKMEYNLVDDVTPNISAKNILKVGTFKIEAHGTKMGEQFIKIITDYAVNEDADICYVTIYEKHNSLINLVQQFGFKLYGTKGTDSHKENVYIKQMKEKVKENKSNGIACCPKCGSASISYSTKKLSIGRALLGGATLGATGAIIGGLSSKQGIVKCLNCGYSWKI
jgi:DNA-directed RNA polymerase subunit M/transcription elongation factor TFIIS